MYSEGGGFYTQGTGSTKVLRFRKMNYSEERARMPQREQQMLKQLAGGSTSGTGRLNKGGRLADSNTTKQGMKARQRFAM